MKKIMLFVIGIILILSSCGRNVKLEKAENFFSSMISDNSFIILTMDLKKYSKSYDMETAFDSMTNKDVYSKLTKNQFSNENMMKEMLEVIKCFNWKGKVALGITTNLIQDKPIDSTNFMDSFYVVVPLNVEKKEKFMQMILSNDPAETKIGNNTVYVLDKIYMTFLEDSYLAITGSEVAMADYLSRRGKPAPKQFVYRYKENPDSIMLLWADIAPLTPFISKLDMMIPAQFRAYNFLNGASEIVGTGVYTTNGSYSRLRMYTTNSQALSNLVPALSTPFAASPEIYQSATPSLYTMVNISKELIMDIATLMIGSKGSGAMSMVKMFESSIPMPISLSYYPDFMSLINTAKTKKAPPIDFMLFMESGSKDIKNSLVSSLNMLKMTMNLEQYSITADVEKFLDGQDGLKVGMKENNLFFAGVNTYILAATHKDSVEAVMVNKKKGLKNKAFEKISTILNNNNATPMLMFMMKSSIFKDMMKQSMEMMPDVYKKMGYMTSFETIFYYIGVGEKRDFIEMYTEVY